MSATQTDTANSYAGVDSRGSNSLADYIARLRADRGLLRRVLMSGGLAVVALVSLAFWLTGGRYVGTDDSYIHAGQLMVSTDVSGLVTVVDVKEGQHVKAGQVLFRIDPKQFQIALDNAKGNLGQTRLTILSMRDDYQRMLRDIAAEQSTVQLHQITYDRYANLRRENSIAKLTVDQAKFSLLTAQNTLSSLQDTAQVQLAKL